MPSLPHEAIIELFRNRPVLAAELLAEVFAVSLPPFTEARIESADIADVIPRELRADLLVLLLDGEAVLVIIVEAQLSLDPAKSFAWPAYVVGARARYRCPACLLVVTPDAALAARLARPIELGPGGARITPFVLGPQGIPVITAVEEARGRPELAVLSAMAHGKTDIRIDVAVAALAASAGVKDKDRKRLYIDVVLLSLGEAARTALERLMALPNYEYKSEFAREYFQKGREEGREKGIEEGIEKGIEKGRLELLVRIFEHRLARPLTRDEHACLVERLHNDGIDRLTDVAVDMPAEELATWLAAKNGP